MQIRRILSLAPLRDYLCRIRRSRRIQLRVIAVALLGFASYAVATQEIRDQQKPVYLGTLEMETAEHALLSLFAAQQDNARVCYQWEDHDPQTGFIYSRCVDYNAATGTLVIGFVNASPGNETTIEGAMPSRLREILQQEALRTTSHRRVRCDFAFVAAELWKASEAGSRLNRAIRRPHHSKRDNKGTVKK